MNYVRLTLISVCETGISKLYWIDLGMQCFKDLAGKKKLKNLAD